MYAFPFVDSWTDDLAGRAVGRIRLLYRFSTTIRSDGDYPSEGIPLRLDSYYTLRDGCWCHQRLRIIYGLTVRLMEAWLTIRTCPLMGCTYRRLGATLGSPKLRLLSSFVSLSLLSLRSTPCLSPASPPLEPSSCVLLCAAPALIQREDLSSDSPSLSAFTRTPGRNPLPYKAIPKPPFLDQLKRRL